MAIMQGGVYVEGGFGKEWDTKIRRGYKSVMQQFYRNPFFNCLLHLLPSLLVIVLIQKKVLPYVPFHSPSLKDSMQLFFSLSNSSPTSAPEDPGVLPFPSPFTATFCPPGPNNSPA